MSPDAHTVPDDDEHEHKLSEFCPCDPWIHPWRHGRLIKHRSFDCQEVVREAEEMDGIQKTVEPRGIKIYLV